MNPLLVKGIFPETPDWVTSCFAASLTYSSLTRFPPDVSFTQPPSWIKALPGNEHDKTSRFWDLARLSFPDARREWLNSGQDIQQTPSPTLGVIEDPDQQMLCMDYLYYAGAVMVRSSCPIPSVHLLIPLQQGEYEYDFSPAWRYVVTHMRWTDRVEAIGELYLRNAFGLDPDQSIPPVSRNQIYFTRMVSFSIDVQSISPSTSGMETSVIGASMVPPLRSVSPPSQLSHAVSEKYRKSCPTSILV